MLFENCHLWWDEMNFTVAIYENLHFLTAQLPKHTTPQTLAMEPYLSCMGIYICKQANLSSFAFDSELLVIFVVFSREYFLPHSTFKIPSNSYWLCSNHLLNVIKMVCKTQAVQQINWDTRNIKSRVSIQPKRFSRCLTSHLRDVSFNPAGNEFAVEIHHDQPSVLFLKQNTQIALPGLEKK